MPGMLSRRGLLLRRSKPAEAEGPRPPWSAARFREACDGCGACIDSCPEMILVKGADRRPSVDFARGGCTFCGDCAVACDTGAIDRDAQARGARAWPITAVLGGACISLQGVACRLCGDPCEPRAIRFRPLTGGRLLPEIHAEHCNGCGVCVSSCPVGAMTMVPAAQA